MFRFTPRQWRWLIGALSVGALGQTATAFGAWNLMQDEKVRHAQWIQDGRPDDEKTKKKPGGDARFH